jgi:NADPH2:quinone reductase
VVVALGSEVQGFELGQKVAYSGSFGAYGDFNAVPAGKLVPIPDEIDFESAAALMLQGMTAHYLVHDTFPVQSGHTVLLHAAAGGVGLLAIQMMKAQGARVIGTVSTPEKAAVAKEFGADEVILYTQQDFVAEVKRLTHARGVHVVYDSVGKTTFLKSLDCLAPQGMLVSFGQSSGKIPDFDPALLGGKGSLYLTRPSLTHYTADREALLHRASQVLKWAAAGTLRVHIGNKFPLSQAAAAHQELQQRFTTGKVLLIP